jgi:hypothetical protein
MKIHEKPLCSEEVIICCGVLWCAVLHTSLATETVKDEVKGEKCIVLTDCCNGPHDKAKHGFSSWNVSRSLDFKTGDSPWPLCSPDFIAPDFYLWEATQA